MSDSHLPRPPWVGSVGDPPDERVPPDIDVSQPSIARVYDAILGGKDNFAVDRAVAEDFVRLMPDARESALHGRAVLGRAIRFMVGEGIRQFIDLGSGLPTMKNTHEVAQELDPDARVAYVDNDPIVLAHARALVDEDGRTAVIEADFRSVSQVLGHPGLLAVVDLDRPVGLLMSAIVHHLNDDEDPGGIVRGYKDAVASGSYLFLTHFLAGGGATAALEKVLLTDLGTGRFRSLTEITAYFDGLELAPPGIVYNPLWRPEEPVSEPLTTLAETLGVGGVGRKR